MIVAHEDDCHRLDHCCGSDCTCFRGSCTCSGAAKLKELVEAGEEARVRGGGSTDQQRKPSGRLDAALQPFREKQ